MDDYNLNGVPSFKEKCLIYYIRQNKLHMCYAFISTIQAFRMEFTRHTICSRERYKSHSHEFPMAIMSSLSDYMPHHS